jgi:hypothetical protein
MEALVRALAAGTGVSEADIRAVLLELDEGSLRCILNTSYSVDELATMLSGKIRTNTLEAERGNSRERTGGQTIEMYHGTSESNAASIETNGFRPSTDGMLGKGVYLSRDLMKARTYGAVVLSCSVRVGRVKIINTQGHELQRTWHDAGYDTAWVPPACGMVNSSMEEDCVYDPSRITVLGKQVF